METSVSPLTLIDNPNVYNISIEHLADFFEKNRNFIKVNRTLASNITYGLAGGEGKDQVGNCDDFCDSTHMREIFGGYREYYHGYVTLVVSISSHQTLSRLFPDFVS